MRGTTASVVFGVLVLGGCSGQTASLDISPSSSKTSETTYVYGQAGSLDAVEAIPIDFSMHADLGIGLSDVVETDRYGSFRGVVLDDSSPLFEMEWIEVSPAASAAYSAEEIEAGVEVAVRFMVEEWVDSPLTWDDDFDLAMGWFDTVEDSIEEAVADGFFDYLLDFSSRAQWTPLVDSDAESWRETGPVVQYEPVPYVDGSPRVAIQWLGAGTVEFTEAYIYEIDDFEVEIPAMLDVQIVGAFKRPVMLLDGRGPYVEHTEGHWTISLVAGDGVWYIADVQGAYSQGVSFQVDGGLASLPTLDAVPNDPPSDWVHFTVDGLTFGLPPSYVPEDPANPIRDFGMTIMLGDSVALYESDDVPTDWAISRWAKMAVVSGWGESNPGWMSRPYGDSFVLDIVGVSWAGGDVYPVVMSDGSIRELVEVTIEVGPHTAYWFDAVLPQGEGLDFLRDFTASIVVD